MVADGLLEQQEEVDVDEEDFLTDEILFNFGLHYFI